MYNDLLGTMIYVLEAQLRVWHRKISLYKLVPELQVDF